MVQLPDQEPESRARVVVGHRLSLFIATGAVPGVGAPGRRAESTGMQVSPPYRAIPMTRALTLSTPDRGFAVVDALPEGSR